MGGDGEGTVMDYLWRRRWWWSNYGGEDGDGV